MSSPTQPTRRLEPHTVSHPFTIRGRSQRRQPRSVAPRRISRSTFHHLANEKIPANQLWLPNSCLGLTNAVISARTDLPQSMSCPLFNHASLPCAPYRSGKHGRSDDCGLLDTTTQTATAIGKRAKRETALRDLYERSSYPSNRSPPLLDTLLNFLPCFLQLTAGNHTSPMLIVVYGDRYPFRARAFTWPWRSGEILSICGAHQALGGRINSSPSFESYPSQTRHTFTALCNTILAMSSPLADGNYIILSVGYPSQGVDLYYGEPHGVVEGWEIGVQASTNSIWTLTNVGPNQITLLNATSNTYASVRQEIFVSLTARRHRMS
ncbi:hypothetical protein F5I97DRAFT_1881821 [Phlebopus sp. FC_14]|nr:hypothetical protein F5I97DRAFT_1881821 [Phlebopus sp. FC_14]